MTNEDAMDFESSTVDLGSGRFEYCFARPDLSVTGRGPWFILWVKERGNWDHHVTFGDASAEDHEVVMFYSDADPYAALEWLSREMPSLPVEVESEFP